MPGFLIMEIDFGTILYILITIIVVIAGIAGKKKKPATGEPSGEGGGKSFFDKLEEQLGGFVDDAREQAQSVKEEFSPGDESAEVSMEQEATTAYQAIAREDFPDHDNPGMYEQYEGVFDPDSEEGLDLLPDEAVRSTEESDSMELVDLEEEDHPDYFEIVSEFDLGTAVIYSAIINRKEF